MDAKQFLAEFGHVAKAPGGIAHLRQMIYQLAVTGSLTPRGESREDAGLLLAHIGAQRQRLIRAKQYKRMVELESEPVCPPQGISLPAAWRWTRLLDIGEINPRNDAPDEQLAAFVPMSGVPQFHRAAIIAETKRWGDIKKGYTHFANGDVVLAKITPCFENGKAAAVEGLPGDAGIGAGTTELQVFRPIHPGVLSAYVYLFLRSPLFMVEGEKNMTGTAGQKRVPTDYFATRAFPLPPSEEQSRIVAKVDELMALCDQLEKQQQDRRKLQNALRQSTLQALATAQSSHELRMGWERLQANFGQLFSEPQDVRDFRGLVLDLAVNGRLLPSTRTPTPASTLLDQIAEARSKWAKTAEGQEKKEAVGMLKKLRTQQAAAPSEVLPEHWRWASLLQVSQAVVDCHNKTAPYVNEGIHLIRTTDIRDGRMELTKTRKISEETYAYWARRMQPRAGDIFFTREAPMGEAAIVPDGERVCLGQRTMLIRLFNELFSNRYLLYVIQSPSFQTRMSEAAIGMTVKHLRVGGVEDLVVPVPPRDEQDRIVQVIDRLFALCDQHARHLTTGLRVAASLASSTVAALTGINIEQAEDTAMKAPQTELVSLLRLATPPDVKAQAPLATILARHQGEMAARDLWQRFGGEIDAFYAQLKTEVTHGWIAEPEPAQVREKPTAEPAKA
ncbi:restriction endonuclease subunit S [Ideonella livida]|uniref:Restriction endonuclease subunit S n=1 Tax=Ideonella livida TaxID=2707176 RepID=A0A7C9TMJ8_9BURK|nr:restriction endonuclease subunit S [Ideonella livida]NDY93382.1 restriction endonuclease subunit S [Ideonella livida]